MSKDILTKQGVRDLDRMYPVKRNANIKTLPRNCDHKRMRKANACSECAKRGIKWCGIYECASCGFNWDNSEGVYG